MCLDLTFANLCAQIYIDQKVVAQTNKPDARTNVVHNRRACDLTVGRQPSNEAISLQFELQIVHIIYADKSVVDSAGVITGQ